MVDKGLYKNGRKGFFTGAQADTKEGKSMSPGTSASGGSRNIGGGGGRDRFDPPPVRTTLPSNIPTSDNKTRTISTDPMDIREQYRIGNPAFNTPLNAPFSPVTPMVSFDDPYSSLSLEQQRYDNYLDSRNLANMNYPGVTGKVPAFIPYSGVINTGINFLSGLIGKKGFEVNTDFFAKNVAGKYGYGYGYEDYKQYMKDRMAGNVNAYGRTLTDAEKGGRDDGGIMQVSQVNPLIPIQDDEENQTAENYDFNYGTASNPIYYSDLV